MADRSFMVKTEEVSKAVESLSNKLQLFGTETKKLYDEVENLSVSWKGATSASFNAELNEYRNVINELMSLLSKFVEGVSKANRNYAETDNALAEKAKSMLGSARSR
jgi:WXG100 family type VII secretion target